MSADKRLSKFTVSSVGDRTLKTIFIKKFCSDLERFLSAKQDGATNVATRCRHKMNVNLSENEVESQNKDKY